LVRRNGVAIKDAEIMVLMDKIREHYHNNINNRYIRKALLIMDISRTTWENLESLTGKGDLYHTQGYNFDELYEWVASALTFIHHARTEVAPNLKSIISSGSTTVLGKSVREREEDKILREMAIKTFPENLKMFAELVKELYNRVVELDKISNPVKPYYKKYPEITELIKAL